MDSDSEESEHNTLNSLGTDASTRPKSGREHENEKKEIRRDVSDSGETSEDLIYIGLSEDTDSILVGDESDSSDNTSEVSVEYVDDVYHDATNSHEIQQSSSEPKSFSRVTTNSDANEDLARFSPIIVPDDEDLIDDIVFHGIGIQHAEIVRTDNEPALNNHPGMMPIHAHLVTGFCVLWIFNLLLWRFFRHRITLLVSDLRKSPDQNLNSPTASRAHGWTGVPGAHCRPKPK